MTTTKQYDYMRVCLKNGRRPAAALLPVRFVGPLLTARCGDARNGPPRAQPKSLAADHFRFFRQTLNRLTQISSAPSASYTLPLTFNYNYNPANQRTKDTLADGSYWVYGYDSLGQVTNACKFFSDGTPVAGQLFDYTFDTIGNRTQTLAGGDATGGGLRLANYSANNLNQITSRDVIGRVDILGASILTNVVTVNGQTAYRKQEYYRQQLAVNNSAGALWTNIIISGGQNVTGSVYVAQEPESFKYDADGNLTNDGRWAYTWDGENRLVAMTTNNLVGPPYHLTFSYDFQGRRIQKTAMTNGVTIASYNFLYDGWNLVAELNQSDLLARSYVWGTDLSGTSQGASGVGGLLEVTYHGSSVTNCFLAFDGNGNVAALINAADGTVAANYEYAAFGEPIRITGAMAKNNPFRFSTKYDDDESDLLYYGYRYYKPSTGTWPNRDPLNESGFRLISNSPRKPLHWNEGQSLYCFLANQTISSTDFLGLRGCNAVNDANCRAKGGTCVHIISIWIPFTGVDLEISYCKMPCSKPEVCPNTGYIDQPPVGDPFNGLGDGFFLPAMRICLYSCPTHGATRMYYPEGTKCPSTFTYP